MPILCDHAYFFFFFWDACFCESRELWSKFFCLLMVTSTFKIKNSYYIYHSHCLVLFSHNFQSRNHSWIGFLKPLQQWIHWRFYFLSLSLSSSVGLSVDKPDQFSLHFWFLLFSCTCVACSISWEWQRNGSCSFCSSYCWWNRGKLWLTVAIYTNNDAILY